MGVDTDFINDISREPDDINYTEVVRSLVAAINELWDKVQNVTDDKRRRELTALLHRELWQLATLAQSKEVERVLADLGSWDLEIDFSDWNIDIDWGNQ